MKLAIFFVSVAVITSACVEAKSDSSPKGANGEERGNEPAALYVIQRPTPLLRVPNYRTAGTFPQVFSGDGANVEAVNVTLRKTILEDQRRYGRRFRAVWESRIPKALQETYPGIYKTSFSSNLISASTVVVSALVPLLELFPAGNDGSTWVAFTVRVPSGETVTINDLFADPARGLTALASAARKEVLSANSCVRRSVEEPVAGPLVARGFDATPENYRHFALIAEGFAIGFPLGQIGAPVCGRVETTVPYSVVRPHLNELGQRLVAGVREPRR